MQQWSGKAAEDKERFDKEMSNYDAPEMSEEDVKPKKGAGKKAKPKKDANAPKKPKSAFIFYGAQVRPQILKDHPELKQTEIMKKVGEMWKAATEEDKAVSPHSFPLLAPWCSVLLSKGYSLLSNQECTEAAKKDKERYAEAMKTYTPPEEAAKEVAAMDSSDSGSGSGSDSSSSSSSSGSDSDSDST